MSSYEDLKDALRENLEARGFMSDIRARVRAEVYKTLEDENEIKPQVSKESELLNELIREYLRYSGYNHTISVFSAGDIDFLYDVWLMFWMVVLMCKTEADLPPKPADRQTIATDLDLDIDGYPPSVPLLYGLALRNVSTKRPHPNPPPKEPATQKRNILQERPPSNTAFEASEQQRIVPIDL
ncbi:hypothetical protein SpCBS45565_g08515 [Spizellomyces sp. 'palustris']|nr:hypothetical protein SpCBS45565_g08515 [Spizellomyces sp. 'palustris']